MPEALERPFISSLNGIGIKSKTTPCKQKDKLDHQQKWFTTVI